LHRKYQYDITPKIFGNLQLGPFIDSEQIRGQLRPIELYENYWAITQGHFIVQGQCARHSPSPCQRYFFGLETCNELLAQTLYFIDVCTRKHESMIFPLSYTHWTMYIFILSKEVHSLKNII